MAIDPSTEYPGKITAPDANYTYGSAKSVTTPTAQDGTPWSIKLVNDIFGFQQKLLDLTGIVPSGNAETQLVSQYFQALSELMGRINYGEDAVNTDNYVVTTLNEAPSLQKGHRIVLVATNANTGACDINPDGLGVTDIKIPDGNDPPAGAIPAGEPVELIYDGTNFVLLGFSVGIIQELIVQDSDVATGSTIIPFDNSIPQNTEGDEYMTQAITPKNVSNILTIEALLMLTHTGAGALLQAAIFQDATANALKAAFGAKHVAATSGGMVYIRHEMPAGTTSPTTFKIRAGADGAGTTSFNGQSGVRAYGGVCGSFLKITERSS